MEMCKKIVQNQQNLRIFDVKIEYIVNKMLIKIK